VAKARSQSDKLFDFFNTSLMVIFLIVVLYPLYLIVISSFSSPTFVNAGEVWLLPKDITFDGYRRIFMNDQIWNGYRNTVIYTVTGTAVNVALTLSAGYVLSRKDLVGRDLFMAFIVFTMFFGGGLIPTYLLVKSLGMVNTIWAMIIPGAVGVYNLIIVRTFFQSTLPDELLEAAVVDGCSNTKFFLKIALPVSLPIVAVMMLFYAVSHWNSFFPALIYLNHKEMYPLQLILREILLANEVHQEMSIDEELLVEMQQYANLIKYGVIIVSSLPVLILYPFLQKYFVKGVMIGSLKG
jgi:putative aldouronate transport system permease protein